MLNIIFFDWLIELDKKIFLLINNSLSNSFFDWFLPYWRNAVIWTPLYIFVLFLAIQQYKKKVGYFVFFALLTVLCTDQLSSHVIKPLVARLRPYEDPTMMKQVHLLVSNIHRGYSFTSSHACNHFGIAIFFTATIFSLKKYRWAFLLWASIVAIAQVYVGVHYPLDILCGAILGIIIGNITANIYLKKYSTL